jgi:hypothetical protein
MIHRQGRSASRRPEHRPEPIRASGHDRRSYTTGWDTIIATRFDKHDANYLASLKLVAMRLWISAL